MTPPIAASFDLPDLLSAIAGERRGIDLTGAVRRSGWENVVVHTRDGWILRFPRDEGVAFEREIAILRLVRDRLPAPIPAIEWTGRWTRFAAYRALTGAAFDPNGYHAASPAERDVPARSLAGFLAAMHDGLSTQDIIELGIPRDGEEDPTVRIAAGMESVPAECRAAIGELLDEYRSTWSAGKIGGPTVLLHNDFHTDNMVFSVPVGVVTGVWDFSCVRLGVPTFDLRYFDDGPADLLPRIAWHYEERTGRAIDVRAARVAARIEAVGDALETGDDLVEVVRRWKRSDATG